ncbi:unnamed protein product [Polarella glacialis]|uniref:Uncharacterized protein n=1 Tax=Polarella glacialis TaxID=89957 RepID=A0A813HWJ6_POLGL|nr:unnamed protein product [Polarella glacialis]
MVFDEPLAHAIAMLVAEQSDKQLSSVFAELQKKLFANVESAVFNQLVDGQTDLSVNDGKSSDSSTNSPSLSTEASSTTKSRKAGQMISHVPALDLAEKAGATIAQACGEMQEEGSSKDLLVSCKMQHQGQRQSCLQGSLVDETVSQRKTRFSGFVVQVLPEQSSSLQGVVGHGHTTEQEMLLVQILTDGDAPPDDSQSPPLPPALLESSPIGDTPGAVEEFKEVGKQQQQKQQQQQQQQTQQQQQQQQPVASKKIARKSGLMREWSA